MKAVAVIALGSPAQLTDVPAPIPKSGEVRVRLQAASVNPFDGKMASGVFGKISTPFVPGTDGAGVVDSLGKNVTRFTIGDPVFGRLGRPGQGTFAEYSLVPEDGLVAPLPDGVEPGVASALPIAGLTAMGVLRELALDKGATILVIGATGGVGSFLVQLAARQGLQVVATARPEYAKRMRELGARSTVDHSSDLTLVQQLNNLGSTKLDGIVDLVGDERLTEMVSTLLVPGGKLISTVADMDPKSLAGRGISATRFRGKGTTAMLAELGDLVQSGDIVVPIDRELELVQGPQALEESVEGHMHGKTIIRVWT